MKMNLTKLTRTNPSLEEYEALLAQCVRNKTALVAVVAALMQRSYQDDIDSRIQLLSPYFEMYTLRRSAILRTSHVFCKKCSFYKPSALATWADNNKELFETEVAFLHKLFTTIPNIIKDVPTFPFEDICSQAYAVPEQNRKERLKMLNSAVTFFPYLSPPVANN
jgi:hypothetical protein